MCVCVCVCVTAVILTVSGCLLSVGYKFTLLLLISTLWSHKTQGFFPQYHLSVYIICTWHHFGTCHALPALSCVTCFHLVLINMFHFFWHFVLWFTFCISLNVYHWLFVCLFFVSLSHFTLLNIALWTWCFSDWPFVFFFILTTFLCELYCNNSFVTFLF